MNAAAIYQLASEMTEQQVLQAKSFASIKNAEKWAAKILN